ncbi:MAG: Crp/Fnr family transcriptional regulator [Cyclobacteriaceae bacterium]
MISEELLAKYGASEKRLIKNELLFSAGQPASYYYQVKSGKIKMNNYNEEGREFIQRIFETGQSFGEPPLLGEWDYPANAVSVTDCTLWRLTRPKFITLLFENPQAHLDLTKHICERLYYKATIAAEMSTNGPEHRIMTLLSYVKKHVHGVGDDSAIKIDLTRQQIGDLCGLRVETAIRTIKKLEVQGKLSIKNRKVFI